MSSRIEQIIEEIEEYVDSCKFQPLSTTKIVVNKEELEELLRELRLKTPDEIKRYQKIISNKDAILADAQAKADKLLQNAQYLKQKRINEGMESLAMFNAMYAEYAQNPDITQSRMYYEAISQILPGVKVYINTGDSNSMNMLLPLESIVGGN